MLPDVIEDQEYDLLQMNQKKSNGEDYPIYSFEMGLRNLSDGSGDGFANDQEMYFQIAKKINENREYFFEAKHANLGFEGNGDIKRLGIGIKNYFSERGRRCKPYVGYGVDFVNSSFRSYQGVNIIDGYQTKVVGIARLGFELDCSNRLALNTFYERSGGVFNFNDANGRNLGVKATKNVYGMGVKYKW